MKKEILQYNVRQARIYKSSYRPSSKLFRFLGALLSILLQGHSQVGTSESYMHRRLK